MKNAFRDIRLYIGILLIIICIPLVLIGVKNIKETKINDLVITKEITVTSNVKNKIAQIYDTRITGTITNQTDKTLTDITVIIYYKSSIIGQDGSTTFTIENLPPEKTFEINILEETNGNFEKFNRATYTVSSQPAKALVYDEHPKQINGKGIVCFIGFVAALSIGIIFIKAAKNASYTYTKTVKTYSYNSNTNTNNNTNSNSNINNINITVTAPPQQERPKQEFIFCKYCGAKNQSTNTKCDSCNSNLD